MARARVLTFDERYEEGADLRVDEDQYTRHFTAKVSSLDHHITALRRYRPDLQMFQPHPEDPGAFVVAFIPEMIGPNHFAITVGYTTDIDVPEDPLAVPAAITFDDANVTISRTVDRKGKAMRNTAGVPVVIEEEFPFTVCRVRKNIAAIPSWWGDYAGAVNSDNIRIENFTFPPRTGRIAERHIGDRQVLNDIAYRECSFSIYHNPDTWDERPWNVSTLEIRVTIDSDGNPVRSLVPVLNDNDEPISEPVFLNKFGQRPRVDAKHGNTLDKLYVSGAAPVVTVHIKDPLEESDLIRLQFETRNQQPFNRLPLR